MTLHIFCDSCYEWVLDVVVCERGILCTCGNVLMRDIPEKERKKTQIEIAKAIWGL